MKAAIEWCSLPRYSSQPVVSKADSPLTAKVKVTNMGLGSTNPLEMLEHDGFDEECGVFGVFGSDEASILTALGLDALQHCGEEAAGIVIFDSRLFHAHRAPGHVGENFGADRSNTSPQFCDACLTGHYPIQLAAGLGANKTYHGSGR
mgnify:CR=1 FL=1